MVKKRLIMLAVVAAVTAAYGYLGQVVGSFLAPGTNNTRGLGMSTTTLYALDLSNTTYIYRMNPTTGSIIGSWATSWSNMNSGMDYGNNYLWIASYGTGRMYWCQPDTGSVVGTWVITGGQRDGVAPYCTGDGGAGMSALFTSGYVAGYYHNMSTGSIIYSWTWPATMDNVDIAYDWRNGYIWKPDYWRYIAAYTTAGSRVASFAGPRDWHYGMAYAGEYLWVDGYNGSNNYIFRIHCPVNVTVAPASLGKVKALFR